MAIDDILLERAREKLRATGLTVNRFIRESLEQVVGGDNKLEDDLEYLELTAGLGHSNGWKFNREELHDRG